MHPPIVIPARRLVGMVAAASLAFPGIATATTPPVKIHILAGQSNMQGTGETNPVTTSGTLSFISEPANDPTGRYQFLKDGANFRVRNDVWMHYERSPGTLLTGGLTAGFSVNNNTTGPELGFGHIVGDALENPVLLVKCAWGGKSLGFDFCPPNSRVGAPPPVAEGDRGFYYN